MSSYVPIDSEDLTALTSERDDLRVQVTELQARMTKMVEERLDRRVREFHLKYGHPVFTTPQIPAESRVKFRMLLIAEEFFEVLTSAGMHTTALEIVIRQMIKSYSMTARSVSLPDLADALADLDYVVEGTRAEFGIHGAPIMDEVQRANMSKGANDPLTNKPTKPADWQPPDIVGALRAQGWKG